MNIHYGRPSRGGRARPAPTPEQIAADFREALKWREQYRAEKTAPPRRRSSSKAPPDANGQETDRRTKFAKDIARLEFGRAYWREPTGRGIEDAARASEEALALARKPPHGALNLSTRAPNGRAGLTANLPAAISRPLDAFLQTGASPRGHP
jgi:hypothetical protein